MSDEEKKAIEILRNYDNEDNLHKIHQSINVVLNLTEKQQEKIKRLEYDKKFYQGVIDEIKESRRDNNE